MLLRIRRKDRRVRRLDTGDLSGPIVHIGVEGEFKWCDGGCGAGGGDVMGSKLNACDLLYF